MNRSDKQEILDAIEVLIIQIEDVGRRIPAAVGIHEPASGGKRI